MFIFFLSLSFFFTSKEICVEIYISLLDETFWTD